MVEVENIAENATHLTPLTFCTIKFSTGRAVIYWEPPIDANGIPLKGISHYLIYAQDNSTMNFHLIGIVKHPTLHHFFYDLKTYDVAGALEIKIRVVDKQGRYTTLAAFNGTLGANIKGSVPVVSGFYDETVAAPLPKIYCTVEKRDGTIEIQESTDNGATWTVVGALV